MALIKCPECGKEVSSTVFKCTNCGFVINKPKRGITGKLFKGLFIVFNGFMILMSASLFFSMANAPALHEGAKASVGAIGFSSIVIIWLIIGLPLGIMNYITRPKAYE